jgi:serine O-acetyltransferase
MDDIRREVGRFVCRFKKSMYKSGIILREDEIQKICNYLLDDLLARMEQDPAGRNQAIVYRTNSFRAVLAYRISHFLYARSLAQADEAGILLAHDMAEYAAASNSIEIHPGAQIGKCFVIDHGINTLIGATTIIGNHCTVLQNIVLGARKITDNKDGKRHPTIGHHVKIAGGVRIFGPVIIGDFVHIGPDCVVTHDIPDRVSVRLVKSFQTIVFRQD